MELEKQKHALVRVGFWILTGGILYVSVRYLLPFVLPFLWGFLIAWMLRPVVHFLCRHSGIGRRGASIVSAVVLYVVLALLCWLLASFLVVWLENFIAGLPELYEQRIAPFINEAGYRWGIFVRQFSRRGGGSGQAGKLVQAAEGALQEMVASLSAGGMQWLGGYIKQLPMGVLGLLFTIISSVLICSDYEKVTGFVMRQIPSHRRKTVLELRGFMVHTVWKVLKAYIILTAITFVMLTGGLAILRVKWFMGIAFVIALLDLLPIIGSGAVLIPWGIYALLGNDTFLGVGLFIVWGVVSLVKQILEPKIIGDQIGLHPLTSLIAMYIGLRFGGFSGLILAPILCLLLTHMRELGIWKGFG